MLAPLLSLALALAPQEPDARDAAVGHAVERGVRFLLDEQLRDGSWPGHRVGFPSGETALALYTLSKCGLPASHPAIRRGLAYLGRVPARKTYSVAVLLLAYEAIGDERGLERMPELLETLLDWRTGTWGYREPQRGPKGYRTDLSNTQFAVMALRAAEAAGEEVPRSVWRELVSELLAYRLIDGERPESDRHREDFSTPAGFAYIAGGKAVRGSMTAGGVAALEIARVALGDKLKRREAERIEGAVQSGLAWLAETFTVEANPRPLPTPGNEYRIYYLYCLERVAALLRLDRLGEHDWYTAGARKLLSLQRSDGSWEESDVWSDTAFALLFLARATSPRTGGDSRLVGEVVHPVPEGEHQVSLRVIGDPDVRAWITALDGEPRQVRRVEYLVDGELAGTVEADPTRAWGREPLAFRHRFERAGVHSLVARVRLEGGAELESPPVQVRIRDPHEPWMLPAAGYAVPNERAEHVRETHGSTHLDEEHRPELAFDGYEETAWVARPDDLHPTLHVEFEKARRASRIVLGQAASKRADLDNRDRIVELELTVNLSRKTRKVRLPENPLEPAVIELGRAQPIRSLTLHVLEAERGAEPRGVGFAEIVVE